MTIYVLRSDNLVKIGFTDQLRKRVQSIVATVLVPVEFVGHMPGGREVEAHLHETFAQQRFSGEWFVETPEMCSLFSVLLIPGLPAPEKKTRAIKRLAGSEDVARVSQTLRHSLAHVWPIESHRGRIERFAKAVCWNKSRVKDLYYGDKRSALRAFEVDQLAEWVAKQRIPAPELKGNDE